MLEYTIISYFMFLYFFLSTGYENISPLFKPVGVDGHWDITV
jgi:hypothetical protein